jgi:hypothetical protein
VLTHQDVDYMSTTSALFLALCRRRPDLVSRLSGVRMSGTQITTDMRSEIAAALGDGICGVHYGNTLGNSAHLPDEGDDETIVYGSNYPQVTITVVDRSDWTRPVAYGEVGQVRLTVMHEDLFLPNILERDQTIRYDTGDRWPWDGVANVAPLEVSQATPEGIY